MSLNKSKTDLSRIYLQDLHVFGTLGQGSFGKVQLVRLSRDTKKFYALKTLKKHVRVHREATLIASVNSDFVVKCHRVFDTRTSSHILLEHCMGGDLSDLFYKYYGKFTPEAKRFYMACVVEGLSHIHEQRIVFRDLKLENLLVDNRGYVKISDFGLSKRLTGDRTFSMAGTPLYYAPEVILCRDGYNESVDYWSLGVLIYTITAEYSPFYSKRRQRIYDKILKGIGYVDFPTHLFSIPVEEIIRKLCKMDPTERLGYHRGFKNEDIRQHRWFKDFDWNKLRDGSMRAPIIPEIEMKPALVSKCLNQKPDKVKDWYDF